MKYEVRSYFPEKLNLPEQQIEEFLITGKINLDGYQRSEVANEIEKITLDIIDIKTVPIIKKLLILATTLNLEDVGKIHQYLNEFYVE